MPDFHVRFAEASANAIECPTRCGFGRTCIIRSSSSACSARETECPAPSRSLAHSSIARTESSATCGGSPSSTRDSTHAERRARSYRFGPARLKAIRVNQRSMVTASGSGLVSLGAAALTFPGPEVATTSVGMVLVQVDRALEDLPEARRRPLDVAAARGEQSVRPDPLRLRGISEEPRDAVRQVARRPGSREIPVDAVVYQFRRAGAAADDDRDPVGPRLDDDETEPLPGRGMDERVGEVVERPQLLLGERTGEDDARPEVARADARLQLLAPARPLLAPQPSSARREALPAHEDEAGRRVAPGDADERVDGEVLALHRVHSADAEDHRAGAELQPLLDAAAHGGGGGPLLPRVKVGIHLEGAALEARLDEVLEAGAGTDDDAVEPLHRLQEEPTHRSAAPPGIKRDVPPKQGRGGGPDEASDEDLLEVVDVEEVVVGDLGQERERGPGAVVDEPRVVRERRTEAPGSVERPPDCLLESSVAPRVASGSSKVSSV